MASGLVLGSRPREAPPRRLRLDLVTLMDRMQPRPRRGHRQRLRLTHSHSGSEATSCHLGSSPMGQPRGEGLRRPSSSPRNKSSHAPRLPGAGGAEGPAKPGKVLVHRDRR